MNREGRLLLVVFLVFPALSLSSCTSRYVWDGENPREAVCVVVENQNFNQVTVFAKRDGARFRLGTVESMVTTEFQIPDRILAGAHRFRLVADPIASSEVVETHDLEPIPGCRTRWMLGLNLMSARVAYR